MLRTPLVPLSLALSLCLVGPACKKASDEASSEGKPPISASRPMTDLGEVVATLQLPSGKSAGGLAKVIDNVQPGISAMMEAQLPFLLQEISGMDLSGADLSGPVAVLVLDPSKHSEPFALLLKGIMATSIWNCNPARGLRGRQHHGKIRSFRSTL